jgi:hypothetical protein
MMMELKHNDKFYIIAYEDKDIRSYRLGIVDKTDGDKLWCRWSDLLYIDELPFSQEEFNGFIFEAVEEEPYSIKWLTEVCRLTLLKFK